MQFDANDAGGIFVPARVVAADESFLGFCVESAAAANDFETNVWFLNGGSLAAVVCIVIIIVGIDGSPVFFTEDAME